MKKSYISTIFLAIALAIVSVNLASCNQPTNMEQTDDNLIDCILSRTSVRAYQDKPVEKDKIQTMLRAAMAAPSGVDKRPWHFHVVTDKPTLQALADANPNAKFIAYAPLAIVISGDMNKTAEGTSRDLWIQDCSASSENLLLAAHALGLGATWTGTFPNEQRIAAVRQALNLPDNLVPFNTIGIGYPAGDLRPKNKWDDCNVTYVEPGQAPTSAEKTENAEPAFHPFDVTKEFHQNGFSFFREKTPILLSGDRDGFNAMTIGWGAIGTLWQRPTLSVYVAQKRYTHDFIEQKPYFTVMTFKDPEIAKFMGSHSGRDTDKAKELGLHVAYTDHGTPYFQEAESVIECQIMYGNKLSEAAFRNDAPKDFYSKTDCGLHSLYMGEVISALKK